VCLLGLFGGIGHGLSAGRDVLPGTGYGVAAGERDHGQGKQGSEGLFHDDSFSSGRRTLKKLLKTIAPHQVADQRDQEQNDEDEEQNLADFDGTSFNAGKAEQSRDQGNHKKYQGIAQHVGPRKKTPAPSTKRKSRPVEQLLFLTLALTPNWQENAASKG
jgi:hypothetical protein